MAPTQDQPPDDDPNLPIEPATSLAMAAFRVAALLALAMVLILVVLPVALVAAGT
jgi:hypothetical protein